MENISRRAFVSSAAVLAAGLTRGTLPAAPEATGDPFGGFTVGIQSYTFRSFNLEQALKRTQEAGLKYAEFYRGHIPSDSSPAKITAVRKLCAEYDVTPIAFGVERFTKDDAANKKLFAFAAALGVKHLSADPDPDSLESLDKLVEEYKISIAIHPHGPSGKSMHRWSSAEMILETVKNHHPLIGTCLDTGHLIRSAQLNVKLDPAQQIKVMGARNFGLHLKDHDNTRKTDVPFGDPTGVLKVKDVLLALMDVKFGGYISIEYEANPSDPSADVKTCLAYFKDVVKQLPK